MFLLLLEDVLQQGALADRSPPRGAVAELVVARELHGNLPRLRLGKPHERLHPVGVQPGAAHSGGIDPRP